MKKIIRIFRFIKTFFKYRKYIIKEAKKKVDFVFPDDLDFCQCKGVVENVEHNGDAVCTECIKRIK